jgi:outer membrane receptor for ferric coprogen and ferric-rhodotorulic acid
MKRKPLFLALHGALLHSAVLATSAVADQNNTDIKSGIEEMIIIGVRENRVSKGATGLELNLKETPQSISVVTQQQMKNFGANSVNEALRLATGIQVEEWETNRTNYVSRGFEIKSTQIDGVGLPNDWGIATGAMESYGYEKIEVIRGANGLLTGVGNASGTLNYVRKRPTNTPQGEIEITAGSDNLRRIEADYSTPLTTDGAWAGRIVIAAEDKDSYLRAMENDRTFIYGVIDGQVGDSSTLTVGYSYQKTHTNSPMWGALVLVRQDGSQATFGRSSSTSQDWTWWDTTARTGFIEYAYAINDSWQTKLTYNRREFSDASALFFVYPYVDSVTGIGGLAPDNTGLLGWPSKWLSYDTANLWDAYISGKFSIAGHEQELIAGLSYSDGKTVQYNWPVTAGFSDPAFGPTPAFPYGGNAIAEPAWDARAYYGTTRNELTRGYAAAKLEVHDRVKLVLGVNVISFKRDGDQTGMEDFKMSEHQASPYGGLTFDITPDLLAYFSYSDIFQLQDQKDVTQHYLPPTKGVNYEIGMKGEWLDRRLLGTVALFKAQQKNLQHFAGVDLVSQQYYYEGVDVESHGVELELTGQINDYLQLVFGFTRLALEDEHGDDTFKYVPRRTANLALTSKLPFFPAVSAGLSGRWQSSTSTVEEYTGDTVREESYFALNAFTRWEITDRLNASVNVNNITDEKYLTSLYQVGYYNAPRNASVSIGWKF